jgi:hypothetical protein
MNHTISVLGMQVLHIHKTLSVLDIVAYAVEQAHYAEEEEVEQEHVAAEQEQVEEPEPEPEQVEEED